MRDRERAGTELEARIRLDAALVCVSGPEGAGPLVGLDLRTLAGKSFVEWIASSDGPAVLETLRSTIGEGRGALITAALERGARTRWVEIEAWPLDEPDTRGGVLELALRDVTARVSEEIRLRSGLAAERTLSTIATRLAGWPDTELEVALRLCLEDVVLRFGARRVRLLAMPDEAGGVRSLGSVRAEAEEASSQGIPVGTEAEASSQGIPSEAEAEADAAGAIADVSPRREDARDDRAYTDEAAERWLVSALRAARSIEALPLARIPEDAAPWRDELAAAGLGACLVVPCRAGDGECRAALELAWSAPRGPVGAEESRLALRLGELFAGWIARRAAAASREQVARRRVEGFEAARERFRGLAALSRFFGAVAVDCLREGLEEQLGVLAGLADAERCWLVSYATGDEELEWFEGWRPGVSPRPGLAPERRIAAFAWSTGEITAGRGYRVSDPASLPEAARAAREDLRARGVRAVLGLPITSGGRYVGSLGFECFDRPVEWSDERVLLLRVAGEILYTALRQHRAVEELRESQAQLLQAQKMEAVGTLAGGIAHDFNNHLAVMLGNARFVRQELRADPEVVEAIEDLERSADHCAQLTRSLLAFSRRSPVEVGPVEVADLVQGVEGLVRPLLPETVSLETVLMPALGAFVVDRVQIQQVLVNLLVNARDAMAEQGGTIRLDARRRPISTAEATAEGLDGDLEWVVLSVRDTGCGMDAATRRRVFEPFFTTKAPGRGTGLGLAMAYGIVRQSRGAISVESTPGQGATFRVYLPSVGAAERDAAPEDAPVERAAAVAGGRVLVLEPEPAVRRLVGRILVSAGYDVELAESMDAVARRLEPSAPSQPGTAPDLVIAAHSRPELGLDAFVARLRGAQPGPPMLLLSGYSAPRVGHAPNVTVLLKPFDEERLLEAVGCSLQGAEPARGSEPGEGSEPVEGEPADRG